VDRQTAGIVDKAKLLELLHEMTDPRSRCADHLRQVFLIDSWEDGFGPAFLPKMCKQQEGPGEAFFAGIKKLVHEIRFVSNIA
jgi:hypothetical protein